MFPASIVTEKPPPDKGDLPFCQGNRILMEEPGEDTKQVLLAPTGLQPLVHDADLGRRLLLEQVQGNVAERRQVLSAMFLVKAGLSRADDTPAPRMAELMPAGPIKGETFELNRVLDDYYLLRGWDANGIPTRERLEALGIVEYA